MPHVQEVMQQGNRVSNVECGSGKGRQKTKHPIVLFILGKVWSIMFRFKQYASQLIYTDYYLPRGKVIIRKILVAILSMRNYFSFDRLGKAIYC